MIIQIVEYMVALKKLPAVALKSGDEGKWQDVQFFSVDVADPSGYLKFTRN